LFALLQVHQIKVPRQGALLPKGDALAVGALVLAHLQVYRVDVPVQVAHPPEGDVLRAVDARVRPHLLVDGLAVLPHVARRAEAAAAARALVVAPPLVHHPAVVHHVALRREEAAAVGALVVAPLLVHRARVRVAVARRRELGEAVLAGVHVEMRALALLFLSNHDRQHSGSSGVLAGSSALSALV
jgi:hypothetical protein